MHDGRVVEQRSVAFLNLRHSLAEVRELRHEVLVERNKLGRLGVSHLVMLILGSAMGMGFCRTVVAVFECCDPGCVSSEGKQYDIVH